MESTAGHARSDADRNDQRDERTHAPADWPVRAWVATKGKLLDEQAFLAALGRGGAQRMAIPLGEG